MTTLTVQVDGQTVPLKGCIWIQREACGCVISVVAAVVDSCWTLATAEQAHAHLEPRKGRREDDNRAGRRVELITGAYYDEHLRYSPWECAQHAKDGAR